MSRPELPCAETGPYPSSPIPPSDLETRTYVAHDGHIWRRSEHGWSTIDPANPLKLMRMFREDAYALPHSHPFKARADRLASELAEAVAELTGHRSAA